MKPPTKNDPERENAIRLRDKLLQRYSKLDEMRQKEAEKESSRDDGWATNRNNPDSPIFKNVFAHH